MLVTCIANTLNLVEFEALIKEEMGKREAHILKERSLIMKIDLRIARIFKQEQNVSNRDYLFTFKLVEKGKSHILLRKALLKDEKESKELHGKELSKKARLIHLLKEEIVQLRSEIQQKT